MRLGYVCLLVELLTGVLLFRDLHLRTDHRVQTNTFFDSLCPLILYYLSLGTPGGPMIDNIVPIVIHCKAQPHYSKAKQ